MQKQLEQYFGCKVKIAEYKNKLQLPIFMTIRDVMMVEIYGVNFAIIDVVKVPFFQSSRRIVPNGTVWCLDSFC